MNPYDRPLDPDYYYDMEDKFDREYDYLAFRVQLDEE
jgi:hypothetical protein